MNDLRTLTAQPQPLTVDGETYWIHPLDVNDLGALQAWIDRQHADPFDVVKAVIDKGGFTVTMQQYMIAEALRESIKPKARLGSAEADELLLSMEGSRQVLYLSIRKGRPDFTEAAAAELAAKLTTTDVAKLNHLSTLDMVASDPKGEPLNIKPPSKSSGSAASRRQRRAAKKTGGSSSTKQ
jgi:hypothetical protein